MADPAERPPLAPARTDPDTARRALLASVRTAAAACGHGIYLGAGAGGWAWAEPERSTLVLGPSRSGKTSSLIIPNVLAAGGAVISTSTKPDVMRATQGARSRVGWSLLYDPSGTVEPPPGVERVGWSPVVSARSWDASLSVADAMVAAGGIGRRPGTDHWSERATALLGPLLHAAAQADVPMAGVLRWVDRHDGAEALATLARTVGERHQATDVLAGILSTDSREQSGIWSTASGVLAAYRSSAALASTEPPYLDPAAFCAGANTLYLCAAGRQQRLLAPLLVGLVSDVRDATYARAAAGTTRPPVLLALDEVANIAPLPDLPALVSEGAGQGLLTLACLQDLSQARARWGPEADAFLSLFGTTMVLPGIADLRTLEAVSALAGEREELTRSVGWAAGPDRHPRGSFTISGVQRRRAPVDVVARGRPGAALAIDATNRLGWVGLTPAHRHAPWVHLVEARARSRQDPGERVRAWP